MVTSVSGDSERTSPEVVFCYYCCCLVLGHLLFFVQYVYRAYVWRCGVRVLPLGVY